MDYLWGGLLIAFGLFLVICSILKSNFVIYRLLIARTKKVWGEKAYLFNAISGILVIIMGILMISGYF